MFLVCTAKKETWKTDRKILFLGEWCKRYDQKDVWTKLDYVVAPYHWDDRKKLHNDYIYLNEVYERYLATLTEQMNRLHGEEYSSRYWRIILGPWLHYFIAVAFDRYASLRITLNSFNVTDCVISNASIFGFIPQNMKCFVQFISGDEYNFALYSYIISHLKMIPYQPLEKPSDGAGCFDLLNGSKKIKRNFAIKHFFKNCLTKFAFFTKPEVVFSASYLPFGYQLLLELRLRQLPSSVYEISIPDADYDIDKRRKILLQIATTEFETLLDKLIPFQIPISNVENYKILENLCGKNYPKNPKVIFTANACISNEVFKVWTAKNVEEGAKLVLGQHGGSYGVGLWNWLEEHETKICDRYFSWGWKTPKRKNIVPVTAGGLIRFKKIRACKNGHILWPLCSLPRYSYHMYSIPVASQFLEYIEDQILFAEVLNDEARKLILLRYFMSDYGWDVMARMRERKLRIRDCDTKEPLYCQLKRSRLFIGTYDATTYLEALSANIPTVLFWNPKHWEIRRAAMPFYNQLSDVGILHRSPASAAKKVNEIYNDPSVWWKKSEVQDVRNRFCKQYAYVSDNWTKEWKEKLLEVRIQDVA